MTKLIGFFLLCALWGCDRWFNEEKAARQKVAPMQKKTAPSVLNRPIVESHLVFDKWFIGDVKAREVVHFEIKVSENGDQFSEVFSKTVKSFWKTKKCRKGPFNGQITCGPSESHIGKCEVFYREWNGHQESFVNLERPGTWPFKVTVGGMRYLLDDDFIVGPTTLNGKLTITKEMILNGDDLAIEVIQLKPQEVEVGFVGFGECEGKGKNNFDFKVESSSDDYIVLQDVLRTLEVTVIRRPSS